MKNFRSIVLSTFLALLLALLGAWGSTNGLPALDKATTFTDNVKIPINMPVFIPCAAGGSGDVVYLSGNIHVLFHTTFDDSGGYHSKYHYQPQGISGTGSITGYKYQGTGVTQGTANGKVDYVSTYVNNFKIIGQGPGNNFLVHQNLHVTVNANGRVTAFVDNFSVKCR